MDDRGFVIFQTAVQGIRALARDLRNKIRRGLDTVETLLSVYAPSSENDTVAYIRAVCQLTGLAPNAVIVADELTLCALVEAIILHENGEQPYPEDEIKDGVRQALV